MPKDRFDHLFIAPSNFDRAVAFYRDSLGWSSVATWGGGGEPRGVILNGGAIELVLAERHDTDDHSWSHGMNGHRPTVHLTVENLDERFRGADPGRRSGRATGVDALGHALVRRERPRWKPHRL